MKLWKFRVKKYKSLVDVTLDELNSFTVIIGANGSGKSNILEALQLFFSEFSTNPSHRVTLTENHWYQNNSNVPIEFEISLVLDADDLQTVLGEKVASYVLSTKDVSKSQLSIEVSLDKSGAWRVKHLKIAGIGFVDKGKLISLDEYLVAFSPTIKFEIIQAIDKIDGGTPHYSLYVVDKENKQIRLLGAEFQYMLEHEILAIQSQEERLIDEIAAKRKIDLSRTPITPDEMGIKNPETILESIGNLIHNSLVVVVPPKVAAVSYDRQPMLEPELLEEIKKLYESEDSEEFEIWEEFRTSFESEFKGELDIIRGKLHVIENRRRYPFHLIGGGFQSWFSFLKHFLSGHEIYILEEPEAHLHPGLIKNLFGFLKKRAENTQIIVATHSPILIDQTNPSNNWVVEKARSESKLYRVEDLRHALDVVGASPSDRMVPDKVLLVEGESDAKFLVSCAEKMGIDLSKVRISPLRGKSKLRVNLDAWDSIASGTQIELFAMLDSDAKDMLLKLVRRGVLDSDAYVILPGEIEDLYPLDLLSEAIQTLYAIDVDLNMLASPPRSKYIESVLESSNKELKGWKVKVAEEVASKIKKKDIPNLIQTIVKKLK